MERVLKNANKVLDNIAKVMVGKERPAKVILAALLAKGHILIEDKPGVGKTMLVKAMARSLGLKYARIQFNADTLPSDITGMEVYNRDGQSRFIPGPIMSNFVLVDELNRGNPRAQSGLLEAMEEGQVTVNGECHPLADIFCVTATQNPVELAGTFPLAEGLLDRFMARVELGYPDVNQEMTMLAMDSAERLPSLGKVMDAVQIGEARQAVAGIYVEEGVRSYIAQLVHALRYRKELRVGLSPRATLDLFRLSRAWALLEGRDYVLPDDIKAVAVEVLAHRLFLAEEAIYRGRSGQQMIMDALMTVTVPVAKKP